MRFWFSVFILLTGLVLHAQTDTVTIHLTVYDSYSMRPLSGVSVINPKLNYSLVSSKGGTITERILKRDTLFLFFPGYRTAKFSVSDSTYKPDYYLRLALEPITATLNQPVIIKAPKTLEEIEEDRKKLGITPKELERPQMSFTSPISALYEMLSGRAQERETLKRQIKEEDKRKIFRELLRYYNENGLIDLPESDYEEFITYCNLPLEFIKYNSDYEITKTIVGLYNKYGRDTGLIK